MLFDASVSDAASHIHRLGHRYASAAFGFLEIFLFDQRQVILCIIGSRSTCILLMATLAEGDLLVKLVVWGHFVSVNWLKVGGVPEWILLELLAMQALDHVRLHLLAVVTEVVLHSIHVLL